MQISSQSHEIGHLMWIQMSNGLEMSQKKSLMGDDFLLSF